jgi:hypothetical protein
MMTTYQTKIRVCFKSRNFQTNKTLLLHIQMELCLISLKEVMKQLNNELNQKRSEVMTPLGYYIVSELSIEILSNRKC